MRSAAARELACSPRGRLPKESSEERTGSFFRDDDRQTTFVDGSERRAPKFGRHSFKVVVGRTIGEKRDKLETKNERAAARKKDKKKHLIRVVSVSLGFAVLIVILIVLAVIFLKQPSEPDPITIKPEPVLSAEPTIEIIDTSTSTATDKITSRMRNYIGLVESDLRSYSYQPTKAVVPVGSIREVDFYVDGYNGYFKTTIDRDAGVTTEDIDRMLRYLADQGITDFEYVDVRIDGRAFWK